MLTPRTIDLGSGRTLHALHGGRGPDLLLIHGAVSTHHDWRLALPAAAAREWRLTIVDRPGHGLSRRPRFAGTPRDQAEQIVAGLDRLGVERPVIAAHSFGALVALALAERFPERVEAMVLVAPLAFPEPRLLEHSLFAPRSAPFVGPLLSWMSERSGFDRPLLDFIQATMFWPEPVPRAWKESFPFDRVLDPASLVFQGEDAAAMLPLSPAGLIDLDRIRMPVRILTCTRDKVVEDERQAKALARLLPQAELTEVPGAGHMLHHSHKPLVAEALRSVHADA
jgi:pimeloyl-ACP methyl ester carboxylesterase